MQSEINLLPIELKTGKDVVKAANLLTRATLGLGVVFFVVSAVAAGVLFWQSRATELTAVEVNDLKDQVQFLEATEQKLVLVKDRLQKAQGILVQRSRYQNIKLYDELIASIPLGSHIVSLEIDEDSSKLTVSSPNSDDLASILSVVKEKQSLTKVEMLSLNFNQFSGYEMVLSIN